MELGNAFVTILGNSSTKEYGTGLSNVIFVYIINYQLRGEAGMQ